MMPISLLQGLVRVTGALLALTALTGVAAFSVAPVQVRVQRLMRRVGSNGNTSISIRALMVNDKADHSAQVTQVTHSSRRPIIAGNWKLNPATLTEATTLLRLLASNFEHHRCCINIDSADQPCPEVVVFPPAPFLALAVRELQGTAIQVGCQTVSTEAKGAFTGETAASMIRSIGCSFVLLGHSERRALFGETDSAINIKLHACLQEPGLRAIVCVGETLEENQTNLLKSVVDLQVRRALVGVSKQQLVQRIVIAYEPIWAIGTGKTASPAHAQAAHAAVRSTLQQLYGDQAAQAVRIQYGGSVTADNIQQLLAQPDVDGALVGGASLTADTFTRIVDGGIFSTTTYATAAPPPPPIELTAQEVVPCANVLGESPVWSARDQALYWISAPEQEVWTWNLRDPPYRRLVGTTLGCVALIEGAPHSIMLAGESAFLNMTMKAGSGDFATGPTILCERPEQDMPTRPNDGRVDRQQRMVFGMYNNYHRAGSSAGENNCGLYRLTANLEVESLLDYKYRVSNCICFPASGDTIFFCDTPTRKIYQFDYPVAPHQGKLTNRRLVWTMPPELPGGPDGAQVDAHGCIWMALSGAYQVVRVNPATGHVDYVVHLPVSSPTSCTFGGPDLDELFITTRKPDGGGLYRVKMPYGIRGLPEPEFRVQKGGPASATIPNDNGIAISTATGAVDTAATYAWLADAYKSMTHGQ